MANKSKNGKKQKTQKRSKKGGASVRTGLDTAAAAYAAVLADPCGAPLSRPLYGGTGSGYLIRCDSTLIATTDATNNGFRFVCTPGAWDPDAGGVSNRGSVCFGFGPANSGCTVYTANGTWVPGFTFLNGQAASFRPVAACVEVTYTGAEQARNGMIGMRNVTYQATTLSYAPAQVLGGCERVMRCPTDTVAMRWSPSDVEEEWNHLHTATDSDNERNKNRSGMEICFVGVGDFRIKTTIVYEWRPNASGEMGAFTAAPVPTRNTINDVLRVLGATGDWVYNTAHQAALTASRIAAGYQGAKRLVAGVQRLAIMA